MTNSTKIDPRGPRFTAAVTLAVFAIVLLVAPAPVGVALLAVQTAFFAIGAFRGVQHTPTAYVFRNVVRPRLPAPSHLEDAAPPRFAQTVGLGFAVVALAGYLLDATLLGQIAAGFALAAALLNAVFGFCLGCEIYLLLRRAGVGTATKNTLVNNSNTKEEVTA
jgi:disulfide bond formation protein DsbB